MENTSPIIDHLLDYLEEPLVVGSGANMTTVLRQALAAQEWLLTQYLGSWLELVGGVVDCEYPHAMRFRAQLRAIGRLAERVSAATPNQEQVVLLESIQSCLKTTLRSMNIVPRDRDLQWGIWARDIPMAIATAFGETGFLDPLICEGIAPCCMYAALLVSQVVTDDGVAEEIADKMFEEKPRALVELMRGLPVAPEA